MSVERICKICLSYMNPDSWIGWLRCPACGFCKKEGTSMVSIQEMMGQNKYEELTPELQDNAQELLKRINKFREKYGIPMYVDSGYRTVEHNAAIGGAKNSSHCTCQAIDFADKDGKLFEYIKANPSILDACDLYAEDPQYTPTWIHLQSRKITSGNRVFIPYSDGRPPLDPNRKI